MIYNFYYMVPIYICILNVICFSNNIFNLINLQPLVILFFL